MRLETPPHLPPLSARPLSDGKGDALPLKPDRCTKIDAKTPRLLFADRFSAVPTTGSIRQSKKYQIVAIRGTGKEETNAGFARCSSAATVAAADANAWRNAGEVT